MLSVMWAPAPAQSYEAAWERIPEQHRALVGRIVVDRERGGMAERRGLVIHLPPAGQNAVGELAHEVGHIVLWARPELAAAWRHQFWPDGEIRGRPASGYGRKNFEEDFAEAYQAMIEDGTLADPERLTFMQTRVFVSYARTEPPASIPEPSMRTASSPCAGAGVPSGSVVAGCQAVPSGSVRPAMAP